MNNQRFSKETADRVAQLLERCESIMGDSIKKYRATRLEMASINSGPVVSGTVVAVDLGPHEDVQWIWSHDPQRGSYVSGYTIVPRLGEERVKRAVQRYATQTAEETMTDEQIDITLAQLERRSKAHGVVLDILGTICDLIKADAEQSAA